MKAPRASEEQSRSIPPETKLKLAVASGARCAFRGCNEYLFEHPITLQGGNFSEHAHIYPFSERGARGKAGERPVDIHQVENLTLLCRACHKLVDDNEDEYTLEVLREMKKEHEDRIRYVTSFAANNRTRALILKGSVGGRPADITFEQIREAVAPMYPADVKGFVIDLTVLGDDTAADYFSAAERIITTKLKEFYDRQIDGTTPAHVSVFALTSIPLLVLFGRHLSDKVATDFFHRHRDAKQPWRWQSGQSPLKLGTRELQVGTDQSRIGVLVSMSGPIERESLPQEIAASASLYEIYVERQDPSVRVLNTADDFLHFRQTYAGLIARLAVQHPKCHEFHLFLATPPPCAILCGLERLPKVEPTLHLYDNIISGETKQRTFVHRLTTR